jgi:hypothetical protein
MTQDPEHDVPEPDEQAGEPEPQSPERVRTGSHRVDEVIRAVEELEERPIEEHVGVFESAQVQLRRALDDHPTEPRMERASRAGDALPWGPRESDPGDDGQVGGAEHSDDHPGHA